MLFIPMSIPNDRNIFNFRALAHTTFRINWNGNPLRTLGSFDAIPITPPVLVILNTIIKNKNVCLLYLVKKSPPGNVAGLKNNYVHELDGRDSDL
jgi:hypothetical protein